MPPSRSTVPLCREVEQNLTRTRPASIYANANRSMDQVGFEGREQEHSSGPSRSSLDRLVENIVSHPSFRATISQALLNNSPSASSSLGLESRRNAIRNGTTTLSPHANADETRRFTSPAEEFSAIYRRGSSAIPGQSPQYHCGNNFQRPAPTAGSVRRRPAGRNRPSSSTSRAMPYGLSSASDIVVNIKHQKTDIHSKRNCFDPESRRRKHNKATKKSSTDVKWLRS